MKNRIIKVALSIAALIMVISVSFAFVAHSAKHESPKAVTTWYFTGSSSEILDASKWTTTNPNDSRCGQADDVPCKMDVNASTESQLQDFLDTQTESDVMDNSTHRSE